MDTIKIKTTINGKTAYILIDYRVRLGGDYLDVTDQLSPTIHEKIENKLQEAFLKVEKK